MEQGSSAQDQVEAELISSVEDEAVGYCTFSVGERVLVRHISDELRVLLECTKEQALNLLDTDFTLLIHEDDQKHFREVIDEAIEASSGKTIVCRIRVLGSDNGGQEYRWARISFVLSGNDVGVPVCSAIVNDVTPEIDEKQKLWRQARLDSLTGLLNRTAFIEASEKLIKKNPKCRYVLGITDINRFKAINELYGAAEGDRVLKSFAKSFKEYMPADCALARLESDHFAFCVDAEGFDPDDLVKHADEILDKTEMNQRVVIYFGFYPIEDSSVKVNIMCERANMALDSIKGNHQIRYAYYNDAFRDNMLLEQQIVGDMDVALANGEFRIHLQPVINASTEELVSAEALVRWYRPDGSIVQPGVSSPSSNAMAL